MAEKTWVSRELDPWTTQTVRLSRDQVARIRAYQTEHGIKLFGDAARKYLESLETHVMRTCVQCKALFPDMGEGPRCRACTVNKARR